MYPTMRTKDIKDILSYPCAGKCQGCKLNIKVLHTFECAALVYSMDDWVKNISFGEKPLLDKKADAVRGAGVIHNQFKDDCQTCPLYNHKLNKCNVTFWKERNLFLKLCDQEGLD